MASSGSGYEVPLLSLPEESAVTRPAAVAEESGRWICS